MMKNLTQSVRIEGASLLSVGIGGVQIAINHCNHPGMALTFEIFRLPREVYPKRTQLEPVPLPKKNHYLNFRRWRGSHFPPASLWSACTTGGGAFAGLMVAGPVEQRHMGASLTPWCPCVVCGKSPNPPSPK